ncbi:DUF397 domain-containing protein [Cryptosporangium aurantiacum]|uniref:DUF397 domain-containing protein n=1 Tax=Cryptosporangium aurantiacum TaxID=134849 RepID=A0A1M7RE88_9ACTN|nr:DUF397 domain-containing protein [Cryptosporangium aurantiacum]SHN44491.1 protein of unknown function [Cryptosporangium aurantiacum]
MANIDLTYAPWRKSSASTGNGNCVEVALMESVVAVRDTKDRGGPALVLPAAGWQSFIVGAKSGEFDLI